MHGTAGQLPHQPGVHRAEQQLTPPGLFPGPLHVVQNPLELGGGEVGVNQQTGVLPDVVRQRLVLLKPFAQGGSAPALPNDGVVDRTAGGFVPDNGGLPLVGDSNGGDLLRGDTGLGQGLGQHGGLAGPDLHRVMFHPARLGVVLGKFPLSQADDILFPVKDNAPAARGALIQSNYILFHGIPSLFFYYDRKRERCKGLEGHRTTERHRMGCGTATVNIRNIMMLKERL